MSCCLTIPLLFAASMAPRIAPAPPPPIVVIFMPPPPSPPLFLNPAAPPPEPPKLPAEVRAVIDAAIEAGDPQAVAAVIRFTKQTNPEVAKQIDAIDADYRDKLAQKQAREERERRERLMAASFYRYWKGEIEAGASRATGNTDNLGLYGSLRLDREGINWRHKVNARIDVQQTNNITTTERVVAAWQPNYKFDDRLYAYGLAQYEHDRFLGFENRYTVGGGLGYRVVAKPKMTIDLEGGPAVRHTDFTDESPETAIAGRASVQMKWTLSPTLQFAQDTAIYLETGNNNVVSTTSLDTRLIGALKMRLSYNIQYERDAPAGSKSLDTLSRATLVYGF